MPLLQNQTPLYTTAKRFLAPLFESTAIQVMLVGRPVKIRAAYVSYSRPLIGENLAACFDGELRACWLVI
jgi:hypothetical protein